MKRIGIEELIALNDEILALSRAGVPLGQGLLSMGADMPRQLRAAAETVGARIEQGESLATIVGDEDNGFPPVYGAVVAAGMQSGRLPVALERLSTTLARVAELRKVIILAAIYPLFLVLLASALFTFVATPFLATVQTTIVSQRTEMPFWLAAICRAGATIGPYIIYVGCGFVTMLILWLLLSRKSVLGQAWLTRAIGWLPGLNRLVNTGRTAAFLETLRLLVGQQIPLDGAIVLAANATGHAQLIEDARRIASGIQKGESTQLATQTRSVPPLVNWLLTTEQSHASLVTALDSLSKSYSERTQRTGEILRTFLPMWLTLAIGGTVTVLYVAGITIPWMVMLRQLTAS